MGRNVSTDLQDFLDLPACKTDTTLDLILADGSELHYSVAKEDLSIGGNTYTGNLLMSGQISQSITGPPNRQQVTVQNVDKAIGLAIANEDLVNAVAVVGRYYRDKAGALPPTWEELFRGVAIPLEYDQAKAELELLHDLTAAGYCVANWTLAEPCQNVFKHAETCGYAGPLSTCNKRRKSPDGCFGRDNDLRFNGMEFPEIQTPEVGSGTVGGGGGGWGGPCFTGETLVDINDRFSVRFDKIWECREAMIGGPVRSFDDDGIVRQDTIAKIFRHWVHEYLHVHFEGDDRPTNVTKEHPYWTALRQFVPVGRLQVGDRVQENRSGLWTLPAIVSIDLVEVPEGCWVYNLETRIYHHYFANRKGVHNSKPIPPLD